MMVSLPRKLAKHVVVATVFIFVSYNLLSRYRAARYIPLWQQFNSTWNNVPEKHPPTSIQQLPTSRPYQLPRIQYNFPRERDDLKDVRKKRLAAVRESFAHAWGGYKKHAWLKDEVAPLTGGYQDAWGGWAATLVDSLDTLWIMGFKDEFEHAVDAVATIDFESSTSRILSVFETTIRYLGGLLAAYDLSGNEILLLKAVELGGTLYKAFDTPNRMPVSFWDWRKYASGVITYTEIARANFM